MNFLERIPTRWLLTAAALACLFLWAGPGWAQTTGDPVAGRLLFEDTPGETGQSQLGSCTNCHSIHDRRNRIAGVGNTATPPFTAVSFNSATNRFGVAIAGNYAGAMGQFSVLDNDQFRDIAAYIADTPKTSVADLDFTATAINTNTLSQHIDLTNAQTSGTLTITSVAISGSGAARFNATADTCTSQTIAASTAMTASSCRVSVRFSAPNTAAYTANLTLTMRVQGSMTTFTRVVPLSGQVATAPPPPSGGGGSGGGGLGLVWLAGLALAVAALARRPRG
jgi:cytochrome c553